MPSRSTLACGSMLVTSVLNTSTTVSLPLAAPAAAPGLAAGAAAGAVVGAAVGAEVAPAAGALVAAGAPGLAASFGPSGTAGPQAAASVDPASTTPPVPSACTNCRREIRPLRYLQSSSSSTSGWNTRILITPLQDFPASGP